MSKKRSKVKAPEVKIGPLQCSLCGSFEAENEFSKFTVYGFSLYEIQQMILYCWDNKFVPAKEV